MASYHCYSRLNRFHVCVLIVAQTVMYFATQQLFPIFLNYTPRWRCTTNSTSAFSKNCADFLACNESDLEFEKAAFHSAVIEFNWFCGRHAQLIIFAIPWIQFAGVFFGTIFFGHLSDRLGRRPVTIFILIFGAAVLAISGNAVQTP